MHEVVGGPWRAVLELFEGELAQVRFPDVDAAALEAAAQRVHGCAQAVLEAEAAVAVARAALEESQKELQVKAQRALAYAKVFAENDAALSEKLAAIELPRAGRGVSAEAGHGAPRRRGRPPKARPESAAPLFEPASASVEEHEAVAASAA